MSVRLRAWEPVKLVTILLPKGMRGWVGQLPDENYSVSREVRSKHLLETAPRRATIVERDVVSGVAIDAGKVQIIRKDGSWFPVGGGQIARVLDSLPVAQYVSVSGKEKLEFRSSSEYLLSERGLLDEEERELVIANVAKKAIIRVMAWCNPETGGNRILQSYAFNVVVGPERERKSLIDFPFRNGGSGQFFLPTSLDRYP